MIKKGDKNMINAQESFKKFMDKKWGIFIDFHSFGVSIIYDYDKDFKYRNEIYIFFLFLHIHFRFNILKNKK